MTADRHKPLGSGFGMRSTASDVLTGVSLKGKNVVFTGGYSGIGIEGVKAMASAGASLTVPARRPQRREKLSTQESQQRGGRVEPLLRARDQRRSAVVGEW